MAEIVSIKVKVEDHGKAMSQVIALKNNIDYINSHPINVKVDNANQLEQITRKMTAYNNSVARRVTAETRLATAIEYRKAEESKAQAALARRETAEERTKQAIERTRQAEERTAQATEKTRQAEERTAQVRERTVQITERQSAANTRLGGSVTGLVAQFVSLHMLLSRTVSAFRDALQTMKDVDSALVTIQKTTGFTGDQLDRLTNSAYELANAYGRTATEILNAASVYARAGFKDNLDQMTELSALLQNVGDLEGEVAAKFLIATNAAWKLNGSYDALMGVIDGLNAQTNQAAVDMEALTSGITVAGSVFSNAGESVQTFAGLLGAGVALTQRSGSEVARGLRTIAMNIRQIKGELDDGEIIDEESISDAAKALHSVGISVADANGELRLTSNVLDDLAERWKTLTTAEQSYLAQSLAGKRQANILNALMNNWAEAQRQMTLYANGAGSALQENEIYLNSWEAKTKQLSAAWTKFVAEVVDTDAIKGVLNTAIDLVDVLNSDLAQTVLVMGGIPVLISTIGGALSSAFLANPVLAVATAIAAAFLGAEIAASKASRAIEDMRSVAEDSNQQYTSMLSTIEQLEAKGEKLTEIERTRLDLLKAEVGEAEKEAKAKARSAYYAAYSGRMVQTGTYTKEWQSYSAQDKARDLVTEYYQTLSARGTAGSTQELDALDKKLQEIKSSITDTLSDLLEFKEMLGDDMPEAGQNAVEILSTFVAGLNRTAEATDALTNSARNTPPTLSTIADKLEEVSNKATAYDTVIGGVVDALNDFGPASYEVYHAMESLENTIPGATDGLYDFETAAWKVESAEYADKEALLDFIDAAKQTKLQPLIDEMERASAAALELAGSIAIAMPGGYNDQFLEAYKAENNPALQKLKQQKEDWDAWVSALRGRSGYSGGSGRGGSSSASSSDPELEKRKEAVALLKAELEFLKAKGASEAEIVAKQKEIQNALHNQAEYMREIEASQTDIYALSTEWWKIQNEITKDDEDELQQHKDRVSLLKSELSLLEAQGASNDEIVAKQRQIQDALKAQENYMRSIGASQTEINALVTEWYEIENKILKIQQELFETVKRTIDEYYDAAVDDKKKELEYEEKILAVQKAQIALQNAQNERNVRYFNAASGQWEWGANAKNVQSAKEALSKAQEALVDYQEQAAWAEFKAAWEYISEQIKSGAITFAEAYQYMYDKMVEIQDKYDVDMSDVLEESVGSFKGVNKTIKDLDAETAAQLGKAVGELKDQTKNLATATKNAKDAVKAFKNAYDDVVKKVRSGAMSFDEAYKYLKNQAQIIADKYGIDMTGALDKAIAQMDEIYSGLDGISKAVQKGALTPAEAFDIISKALNAVSEQYSENITAEVNRILEEKGGIKDGLKGLAEAVANGEMTFDDAWALLESAISDTTDLYGIDLRGELDTAIQNMGKSADALDQLWKTIVMNKMRMNSVSWLELDAQEKKAQASGDTALAKQVQGQKAALHAENEALGETIGATYDPSGYWSLNGQQMYDPVADQASGNFSGGGGGGGSSTSTTSNKWASDTIRGADGSTLNFASHHTSQMMYVPGYGFMNVSQEVANLMTPTAGRKGDQYMSQAILANGTQAEIDEYFKTNTVPANFAAKYSAIYKYNNGYLFDDGEVNLADAHKAMVARNTGWQVSDWVVEAATGETPGVFVQHGQNGTTPLSLIQQAISDVARNGAAPKYDSGGVLHGIGGIKATARDEMVLPPDITERLLTPINNGYVRGRMDDLRSMLGMQTEFGSVDNTRIGTQNNGDIYTMNGVTISEGQAKVTTVYDLAQMARNLGAYKRS